MQYSNFSCHFVRMSLKENAIRFKMERLSETSKFVDNEAQEKLAQILALQQLQGEVLNFRNNGNLLRKILKQTCIAEVKKLQNIEIAIAGEDLKLLPPEQWPKFEHIKVSDFNEEDILSDIENTAQAMDLLM